MTNTPVPEGFKFTWSYSSISTFEICPRKWWAEKVSKTAPWETNAAATWGTEVHEQFEHRAQDGAPLPANMSMYQGALDKVRELASMAQEVRYEYQMGVSRTGIPCGFDAPEMYGRSIADFLMVLTPRVVVIGDYKTGRYYGSTLQPLVNAKLAFLHFPEAQEIKTSWVYLKERKTHREDFHRETIDQEFGAVQHVIDKMESALAHQNFPARRGFLCRSYCSDYACPHNGRKRPTTGVSHD